MLPVHLLPNRKYHKQMEVLSSLALGNNKSNKQNLYTHTTNKSEAQTENSSHKNSDDLGISYLKRHRT